MSCWNVQLTSDSPSALLETRRCGGGPRAAGRFHPGPGAARLRSGATGFAGPSGPKQLLVLARRGAPGRGRVQPSPRCGGKRSRRGRDTDHGHGVGQTRPRRSNRGCARPRRRGEGRAAARRDRTSSRRRDDTVLPRPDERGFEQGSPRRATSGESTISSAKPRRAFAASAPPSGWRSACSSTASGWSPKPGPTRPAAPSPRRRRSSRGFRPDPGSSASPAPRTGRTSPLEPNGRAEAGEHRRGLTRQLSSRPTSLRSVAQASGSRRAS